jgi:hypothetical protein
MALRLPRYHRWLLVYLLWPLEIGPEVMPESPRTATLGETLPRSSPRPAAAVPPLPRSRPLTGEVVASIDDAAFRAALARQAGARLTPCLRSWRSSPAQVLVKGQLDRQGRLRSILSLDPAWPLPDCATSALEEMSFAAAAAPLKVDATNVEWRLDW